MPARVPHRIIEKPGSVGEQCYIEGMNPAVRGTICPGVRASSVIDDAQLRRGGPAHRREP